MEFSRVERAAWRSISFPPPPQAELCLARGNVGTAVNIGARGSPKAADLTASPGSRQEPAQTPPLPGARAAGGDAEGLGLGLERPKLAVRRRSPPLPYCQALWPEAEAAG